MYEILELWDNTPCQYDSFEDFQNLERQDYIQSLYDICQKNGLELSIEDIEKFITFLNYRDDEFDYLENLEEYRNTAFDVLAKIIKFNENYNVTNYYIMISNFVENNYLSDKLYDLEYAILMFNYHSQLVCQHRFSKISNIDYSIISKEDRYYMSEFKEKLEKKLSYEGMGETENDINYTRPYLFSSSSSNLSMLEKRKRKEKTFNTLKRTRKDKRNIFRRY